MSIPKLSDIKDSIISQLSLKLSQTIPLLDKSFTIVQAGALAGQLTQLYKYAGFSFLQLFVKYASTKGTTVNGKTITPLVEWGRLVGAGDPLAAERAELVVDVTVLTQTGSIAAGAQLLFPATGVVYVVKAAVALDARQCRSPSSPTAGKTVATGRETSATSKSVTSCSSRTHSRTSRAMRLCRVSR
jgi:hypothetical protein